MATSEINELLFDQIRAYLAQMDLGDLFTIGSDGTPGGWLWEQITTGVDSEAALMIALEQTATFQRRYGIITELRQQAQSGAATHVPTVAEVREYEQTVSSIMRQAGLPTWMYDQWADTHELMRNGLSAVEVEQRLGQAWERVRGTDPAVRQAFSEFYGIEGDAALASMFLDPTRTMSNLERASRAAYTAGYGRTLGIDIDRSTAERIADLPKTEAGIQQDLGQVSAIEQSSLLDSTIGESGSDLDPSTAVDAVIFGDGKANTALERRTIERKAQNAAVPGGALRTNRGLTGVG